MKKPRIHIVVAVVLFGILLWLSVTLRESYQINLSIPVILEDIPPMMAVRTPVPRALNVKINGEGWKLIGLEWGPTMRISLPIGSSAREGTKITFKDFADRLPLGSNIHVVDVKPESILVYLDRYAEKKVPVQLDGTFHFRDGYGAVEAPVMLPESVTVGGAESVVRSIVSWKTEHRSFDDLRSLVDVPVPLLKNHEYAFYLSPTQIQVRLPVEPFAEKIVTGITVEVRSLPKDREVIFIPPRIEIVARGGIRHLANVAPTNFMASVEYELLLSTASGRVEPTVQAPSGVQVVSKRPDRLQYVIRKK
jgi:YbbR domain-containing protein